eukprot:TRINITY_DN3064_c1_g1_i1.p1 TRINITY_DN3064_c1_g1~~TRINITY_DN3064_c1_g1_i1.p1  ORF type:complete len:511 (+),score=42.10 TRINITY_DN3064_c1_g1_i1:508-2040(+)
MGCGASAEEKGRALDYKHDDIKNTKKEKVVGNCEEHEVQTTVPSQAHVPQYTTSNLVSKHRKGIKYSDLPDTHHDEEEPSVRSKSTSQSNSHSNEDVHHSITHTTAPSMKEQLWNLITGQRTIEKRPGAIPVSIHTDFGKVAIGIDRAREHEIADAEDASEVTNILISRSVPVTVKRIRVTAVRGHPKSIRVAVLSPNDWLLVSTDASIGSSESSARVTDIRQQVICGSLDGRRKDCYDSAVDASFTIDGSQLATVHRMESVLLWDMNTFRVKKTMTFSDDDVGEVRMILVRISPDSKLLAVGVEMFDDEGNINGCVLVYDIHNGKMIAKYTEQNCGITSICFSPSGKHVASGSFEGRLMIWNARTGEAVLEIDAHSTPIRALGYTPDGKFVITCDERTVCCWDVGGEGDPVWTRLLGTDAPYVACTPKSVLESIRKNPSSRVRHTHAAVAPGGLVAIGKTDRTVQLLNISDGTEYCFITTRSPVTKISSGCRSIALGDLFGNLYIVSLF